MNKAQLYGIAGVILQLDRNRTGGYQFVERQRHGQTLVGGQCNLGGTFQTRNGGGRARTRGTAQVVPVMTSAA